MTVEELGKIEELEKQIASLQEEIRKLKEVNEKKELKPHRVNEGFAYYISILTELSMTILMIIIYLIHLDINMAIIIVQRATPFEI